MLVSLYLLVVVILFSGNILVGKAATENLPPFTLATARMGIAFLTASICFGYSSWRYRYTLLLHWKTLTVMAVTGLALFNSLIYVALHTASATDVAVLETGIPVVTAIVMAALFNERLSMRQWIGVLLSMMGAVWVITNGQFIRLFQNASLGSAIMLGAIACWVIHSLAVRRWWHALPAYASLPPITAIGTFFLIPLAVLEHLFLKPVINLSFDNLAFCIYLGLGPSLIAFVLYNKAVEMTGPSRASLALNLLPVATMLIGYAIFDYKVSFEKIIGSVIVMSGVCMVILPERRCTIKS